MNIFLYVIQQIFIQLLKISICGISIFGILWMFQILIWQIHMLFARAPSLLTFDIYFKYIIETCIRIWYLLPLILLISLQSSAISQKLNFFGLVLNTEGRPWPALYWYLLLAYLRSLYLNMGTSGIVFHPISPVIRLPWWKAKFPLCSFQYVK